MFDNHRSFSLKSSQPSPQDTNITRVGDGGIELPITPRSLSADRTGNTGKLHGEVGSRGPAACCATSLSHNVTSSYLPSHLSCFFLLVSFYLYLLPLHSRELTPNPNDSNANAITPFLACRKTSTLDGPGPWDRLAESMSFGSRSQVRSPPLPSSVLYSG
jgi:hypothetical protein